MSRSARGRFLLDDRSSRRGPVGRALEGRPGLLDKGIASDEAAKNGDAARIKLNYLASVWLKKTTANVR